MTSLITLWLMCALCLCLPIPLVVGQSESAGRATISRLSFVTPFMADDQANWKLQGSAQIAHDGFRLGGEGGWEGLIASTELANSSDLELLLEWEQSPGEADERTGLAVWITADPPRLGSVLGAHNRWNGLLIGLVSHPDLAGKHQVVAVMNDGGQAIDAERIVELSSINSPALTLHSTSQMFVEVVNQQLHVSLGDDDDSAWVSMNVTLPSSLPASCYISLSAMSTSSGSYRLVSLLVQGQLAEVARAEDSREKKNEYRAQQQINRIQQQIEELEHQAALDRQTVEEANALLKEKEAEQQRRQEVWNSQEKLLQEAKKQARHAQLPLQHHNPQITRWIRECPDRDSVFIHCHNDLRKAQEDIGLIVLSLRETIDRHLPDLALNTTSRFQELQRLAAPLPHSYGIMGMDLEQLRKALEQMRTIAIELPVVERANSLSELLRHETALQKVIVQMQVELRKLDDRWRSIESKTTGHFDGALITLSVISLSVVVWLISCSQLSARTRRRLL